MDAPYCTPVTPEQAARNLAHLALEVADIDRVARDRPAPPPPAVLAEPPSLSPQRRAALMTRVKPVLLPLAQAVAAGDAGLTERLTEHWGPGEWVAAAIAAIAAADPCRLRLVGMAVDDGLPYHPEGQIRAA